ncbi:hypothetical protein TWF696_003819 [Orbilia brochopaga]|uniref:Uncharacterized protein n=1 Tax=Orbilia brochopaga TaxID=3140254 RepID=A0AAV9V5G8_9PEZI
MIPTMLARQLDQEATPPPYTAEAAQHQQITSTPGRLPYRNHSITVQVRTVQSRSPSPTPASTLIRSSSSSPTPPTIRASRSSSESSQVKPLPRPPLSKWSFKKFTGLGSDTLDNHDIQCWKPFTLRTPFLLFLIVLTVFFIIAIELLFQKSQRDGSLTFAVGDGLTGWQVFISQYMGTVASVIFAILLSLVDLDAKRLEPWFQLSRPDGATAKNSILLCYPFDFLAFVPFKAAKRGHQSIFYIGTATVLVFWFITPLQSSLIATVQQQVVIPSPFRVTETLQRLSAERSDTSSFTYTAYSISWLNSTPPAYSTKLEATLPFEPLSKPALGQGTQLWTGNTTAYYIDLNCNEATQTRVVENYVLSNGKNKTTRLFHDKETNCTFQHDGFVSLVRPDDPSVWRPYYAQLVGYNPGANSLYYLNTSTCQMDVDPHMFLIIVSYQPSINDTADVDAVYCKLNYRNSVAEVTVDADSKLVQNVTYIGAPEDLSTDQFDASVFETVLSGGGVGIRQHNGGPFSSVPLHSSKTREINALLANSDWDFESSVLGYMFAIDADLSKYLNPDFLASTITKAYKLLFTTYVTTQLMVPDDVPAQGRILFTTDTVVVPEVFARILEGLLAAVVLLLVCFFIFNIRRRSGLVYDPASLAGTMALVANEPRLLDKFGPLDGTSSTDEVHKALTRESVRFRLNSQRGRYQLSTLPNPISAAATGNPVSEPPKSEQETNFELGATVGSTFVLILTALVAFSIYIFQYNNSHNGLPSFSTDIFVFQLLFSYIPTAIGTLLEPFWVLLTRFICVLQPLETLRRGNALASKSLTLKFESVPPSLTVFSALRSKHYFLSILAATALSTNILAIALGALFNPTTVPLSYPSTATSGFDLSLQALPFAFDHGLLNESMIPRGRFAVGRHDHYYTLYANFTSDTPLPAWTTPRQFFIPVNVTDDQRLNSSDLFQAETVGLSASLACEAINVPMSLGNNTTRNPPQPVVKLLVRATAFENSGPICELSTNFQIQQVSNVDFPGNINLGYMGPLAMEAYPILRAVSNTTNENQICGGLVPVIVSRTNTVDVPSSFQPSSFEYKTIICRPKVDVGRYEITFDASHQILSTNPTNSTTDDKQQLFQGNISETQLLGNVRSFFQSDYPSQLAIDADDWLDFSNNSLPTEWIDVMLQKISNSTTGFDPRTPLQDIDIETIGQDLSKAYGRVFAVLLGLYHNRMLARNSSPVQQPAATITSVLRVQMSTEMFVIILVLLVWYLLLAIYFYLFRVARLFQRLPTSLASEIQLFHKSSVLDDLKGTELLTGQQRKEHLARLNYRYGYGRFLGRDNVIRVGIEREPLLSHLTDAEVRNNGLGRIGLKVEKLAGKLSK